MFSTISIILCVVDVPLYAFHVSMIVFLVAQMVRGVDQFKQGFFVVYLAVSVADCLYIAHSYLFVRLPHNGYFVEFYSNCSLCPKIGYQGSGYFSMAQLFGHVVMAANRFTVFFAAQLHQRLWRGKKIVGVVAFMALAPLGAISYQLPVRVDYVWLEGRIVAERYENESVGRTVPIATGVLNIAAALICAVFNLSAALRYRSLIKNGGVQQTVSKQDVQLLAHAVILLIFLILRALYNAATFVSLITSDESLKAAALRLLPLVTDGYCLLGSVFLITISPSVREGYTVFYGLRKADPVVFASRETTKLGFSLRCLLG